MFPISLYHEIARVSMTVYHEIAYLYMADYHEIAQGGNFVCKGREKCAEIDFFGAVWYNKGKQECNTALSAKSEFSEES